MRLVLLILLVGCAQAMKKEFKDDVRYHCPPQECAEGEMNAHNDIRMNCECIPVK